MRLVREIFNSRPITLSGRESSSFALNDNLGIELELEGFRDVDMDSVSLDYWNAIYDGSLRNNGIEFVLKQPERGENLLEALGELQEFLEEQPSTVSHRCSAHFHIDVRDLTIAEAKKLFWLLTIFEPSLYAAGSKHRYSNIYCPGLTHATEQVHNAALLFLDDQTASQLANNWEKYSGINLNALARFGSIEVRGHEGTTDIHRLRRMSKMLLALKAAAKERTEEEIQACERPTDALMLLSDVQTAHLFMCDEFQEFWPNARTNLQYFVATQQVAQSAPEGRNTDYRRDLVRNLGSFISSERFNNLAG